MASQFHIIYSSRIMGVGSVAGCKSLYLYTELYPVLTKPYVSL